MKKIIGIFITLIVFNICLFLVGSYAATLDTLQVLTDKTTVRPGEEVTVTINFGQLLGAGDFNILYDNNIFDYVSNQGGTASDTGNSVAISYYSATSPIDNITVTFKAKSDITTSNPTEFTVTASDLVNTDATVFFDDITTPIVKNITVEPAYIDYTLSLKPTARLVKEQENAMTLSYSSAIGRYYTNARLIAEVTAPGNAVVKLLATDTAGLEHDIVQSGWGDAQGYPIGGPNFAQVLNVRGVFTDVGNYTITLKLIDRGSSDAVIAQKSFDFSIGDVIVSTPEETPTTTTQVQASGGGEAVASVPVAQPAQASLVYTGKDNYFVIGLLILPIIIAYACYRREQ